MKKWLKGVGILCLVLLLNACNQSDSTIDFSQTSFNKLEQRYILNTVKENGENPYFNCMPIIEDKVKRSICKKHKDLEKIGLQVAH